MFITTFALAVALLVLGVLWAERWRNGWHFTDNALDRARVAFDDWRWARHIRAQNAARPAERLEAAE
jgi:hypothetical protein